MKRRVLAGAAAAATVVALVPAAPAFAAVSAQATLAPSQKDVWPGAQSFTITVTNKEAAGVLGIGAGSTINAIRVNLPVNEANVLLDGTNAGSATGCTSAKTTNLGTTQFVTYTGCSIAPGASSTVTLPAVVGAPASRDLTGDFRVQVSDDGFQTAKTATGSLVTEVNVLKVLSLAPVAPTAGGKGVTDGTGTAGQGITYAAQVKNFARSALTVAASVASSTGGDSATPVSLPIASGETATASIPVRLADLAGTRTFTSSVTTSDSAAPALANAFTAEAKALVASTSLDGTRVPAGPGSSRTLSVTLSKTNAPAVDAFSASLAFAGNTCSLASPVTFPRGSGSASADFLCTAISGADGSYPAAITYSVDKDDNLAGPYGGTIPVGTIVIDTVSPLLTLAVALPKDRDGDQQTAVKNGNTITVSGTVDNAGDLASNSVRVTLQPDKGDAVVISAPVSGSGEKRTFTGTASPTWDAAATSFTSRAEAADLAGNLGAVQAPGATVIDNVTPSLTPSVRKGTVVDPTTIEVVYTDATAVLGGCDAKQWSIDSSPNTVSSVTDGNGDATCKSGSATRVLTLKTALGPDQTPTVTFNPLGARTLTGVPVKDGAGNDALRETVDTVTQLVPQAPQITKLERKDKASGAFEPAYLDADDSRYYTNVGGADAVQLTVAGIRQNYTVQVVDGNGTPVASRTFTAAPGLNQTSYEGSLLVPLGTADGAYGFGVRLISSVGNAGPATPFSVVLDTVAPKLGTASLSGSTVTETFTEKVVLGSDFADNWFVSELVDTENGTAKRTVNVDSVTADGPTTRSLQVTLQDPSRFAGVDYFFQSGTRYEDRAGNTLADTLSAS